MSSTPGDKVLVTGALGQIGTDLVQALRERHGSDSVIASDIRDEAGHSSVEGGPFVTLDVLDTDGISRICQKDGVGTIYHLAALLSAVGERDPDLCRRINVGGTISVLEAAKECNLRVYSPSSIAVFGPDSPRHATQDSPLNPTTVYGETKVTGEALAQEYLERFNVDTRGIRYPGLISYKAPAGGGTTDYAVEIFHAALNEGHYQCFVRPDTRLPMLYMDDAINATLSLMDSNEDDLGISRSGYNIPCLSFSAGELVDAISERIEGFTCDFVPDVRQEYADSWPDSIDGSLAEGEWGWTPEYDLNSLVDEMLKGISSL
ncbi:MAG: NAD-dependent epimerase/dehydratase family protein [Candidatus Thalassarchaeaceae archaeon]|jgi:nucleoside-diphosphate-sugar epimerase|nr:NAD-dependent epimerase/dehydratase family protein [Candidatus Thalassarchaeaceae archaeon]|tara:strand:+ start:36 stop:992 length:957 start_codon:yes stop_codon:yes gene_type:complete